MNPERWKQIDELFDAALELHPNKRSAFLDEACAGDEVLRKEVEVLLASDQEEHSLMEASALQAAEEFLERIPASRLSPGESIGPYKILSLLGTGGMGEVYRARDQRLERDVAIKVLPEDVAKDAHALARFDREAKALAALSHPNILAIYDVGEHEGIVYAVMELLKGETLRSYLARTKFNWEKAVAVGTCIVEGLAAAHSQGVVHRDLKPENIFLTSDGGVKILDFGLVRREPSGELPLAKTESQLTEAGILMGTVPYMSPEQLRRLPMDARSDLFSFGTTLYEMISGTRPFVGNSAADLTASILKEEPAPITIDCPPALLQAISRCLKKDPKERFQTAGDLALELKTVASGSISPIVLSSRKIQWKKFLWIPIVIAALVFSLLYLPWKSNSIHSIAVLPFINGTQNPEAEYLSDGISESIIFSISKLPNLRVMARDTVFTYKGKEIDPRKIGQELNVEAIVTGRVVQQGNTLVIRAHLVKAADGTELWGDQYNRSLADVLATQEEISREICKKLRLRLTGQEQKLLEKHYTRNNEAYQLYLKGLYHRQKATPEDYEKSIEYFKRATQKDPNYALAYAGLAAVYSGMSFEGLITPKEARSKIEAATKKAIEIDPNLGEAVFGLAGLKWFYDWDFSAGLKELERAIALNPNDAFVHRFYSQRLRALGRFEEAITEAKRALELDPLWFETNIGLGATYFWAGEYDQAIEQYKKTIYLDPNFPHAHDFLADVYARKGMYKEAIEEEQRYLDLMGDKEGGEMLLREFEAYGYAKARQLQFQRALDLYKETAKHEYVSPMAFAAIYAFLNQKDEAFVWLEKAYAEKSPALTYIKTDPEFENLRSDPRFAKLLQRIGLPL